MKPLHVDAALVSRIQAVQFEYVRGRMNAMCRARQSPNAAIFHESELLRACIAPGVPNPSFNQLFIAASAPEAVVEALTLFAQHGMSARVELSPAAASPAVAIELARRGLMHTQSDPVFVERVDALASNEAVSDVDVQRVTTQAELEAFRDVYLRGWQVEDWLAPILRSYIGEWLGTPGWSLYLATQGKVLVGCAVLFVHAGVAYLADAATAPEFRGRGAQAALIQRRLVAARSAAAELVCGRAEFGSVSHRNFERAGLPARFTAAIWSASDQ